MKKLKLLILAGLGSLAIYLTCRPENEINLELALVTIAIVGTIIYNYE